MVALGETLKLGYLECGVKGGSASKPLELPPKAPVSPGSIRLAQLMAQYQLPPKAPVVNWEDERLGKTLKFDDVSEAAEECPKDEVPIQPLEWTRPPLREVQRDGNVRYQVSKASNSGKRDHQHHLIQTTRIEPRPSSGTRSRSSSRPSSRKGEEIVVTEADFQRCGNRMTLLRQCKLNKMIEKQEEDKVKAEMALSFKSAFAKKCKSQDNAEEGYMRDCWKEFGNPEYERPHYEGDLVLNQVWSPPKKEPARDLKEASEFAHAIDEAKSLLLKEDAEITLLPSARSSSAERTRERPEVRLSRPSSKQFRSERRSRSETSLAQSVPTTPPLAFGGSESHSRRASRHASGCPKPASGHDSSVKKKRSVSRIQLIDDNATEEEPPQYVGSLAVQEGARKNRRFMQELSEDCEHNKKEQALWLSLDPLSGEVSVYPRAAATRLEDAYVNNRTRVPLAGLAKHEDILQLVTTGHCAGLAKAKKYGDNFEDEIVHMGMKGGTEHPVQSSTQGGQRDVRRLMIRAAAPEVSINIMWEHRWRIADVAIPGRTEKRTVVLHGTETVRPSTPPLPPVNPDRRASINCVRPWCVE